jgi:hypothetical protein
MEVHGAHILFDLRSQSHYKHWSSYQQCRTGCVASERGALRRRSRCRTAGNEVEAFDALTDAFNFAHIVWHDNHSSKKIEGNPFLRARAKSQAFQPKSEQTL